SSANTAAPSGAAQTAEASASPGAHKLKIETSFYPMYEFTRNVAGDLADVDILVPAGVEPHDWEPSPQDIANIADADLLVYNGAGMESWVEQVLDGASGGKLAAVDASKGLDTMEGHAMEEEGEGGAAATDEAGHDDHDHGALDPHVWLSPALAIKEVRNIEAALREASPADADTFKANADAYIAKLEQLDQDFKNGLKDTKRKDFITQHAAFGYLAREYGLTQVPIAGLSPEHEPSAAQMAGVVKFAKEHNVKTIFFETLVSSKVSETVAREAGAQTAVLNPIEGLTDEDRSKNLDYIGIMSQNLEALKAALNE
ncbi:metal ABC transporter substrate-binding protein, partial [Paenibacillus forsythiae]